jgi:hypothetical protein
MGALHNPAAVAALNEVGGAAAVEEKYYLFSGGQSFTHFSPQQPAEYAAVAGFQFLPQVYYIHLRQGRAFAGGNAPGQFQQFEITVPGAVICGYVRCGAAEYYDSIAQFGHL